MDEQKLKVLVWGLRECVITLLGVFEDFLGVTRDKSALAKRRESVK